MSNSSDSRPTLAFAVTMHRSGSSVTMNVLQALGASLGPFPLNGASTGNKYGHFESMPLLMLDREVLFAAHGYRDEELFQSPDLMARFRESQGAWNSPDLREEWLRKGRNLLDRMAESGDVVAFKDPRVPLIWPFWKTLLEELTGVRIVLLFLVRAPHAIAMSIYSRSGGEIAYDAALDATEAHLRQMIRIRDEWQGESALVRFQGEQYFDDLRSAAQLCGLAWSDETARQIVDPEERHQRAACIDHPAQRLFEELAGEPLRLDAQENHRILQQDAIKRESILRKAMHDWRAKCSELARAAESRPAVVVDSQPVVSSSGPVETSRELRIPRLILHIGTYKTGTSSIQRYLDDKRAILQARSICYPRSGKGNTSPSFAQHALAKTADHWDGSESHPYKETVRAIQEEFRESRCDTLLISAEDLSSIASTTQIAKDFPADAIDILVAFRPQQEIATPLYYTTLASYRSPIYPEAYLIQLQRFFDYAEVLRRWRNAYPHAKFHVRRFERGQPAHQDSVKDFVGTLKLPLDASAVEVVRDHPTLPARGILALRALAEMNLSREQFWEIFQLLHRNRDLLGKEKSVYSPSERGRIHEQFRESNRDVREEFMDGVREDLFDEPQLGDEEQWQAEVGDPRKVERDVLAAFAGALNLLQYQTRGAAK